MKRDVDKTAAANFVDPRSFVRPDGRQRLFGKDMEALRHKVFERSMSEGWNRCECEGECGLRHFRGRCWVMLTWFNMELSHKISRGKGGSDSEDNCIASCHGCHVAYEDWSPRWTKRQSAGTT